MGTQVPWLLLLLKLYRALVLKKKKKKCMGLSQYLCLPYSLLT